MNQLQNDIYNYFWHYRHSHLTVFYIYSKESLELGDLKGNHFTIALRDIHGSDQVIATAVENLRQNGFINYFGQQRFGTASVKTSDIGLALIKSQWMKAIGNAHLWFTSQHFCTLDGVLIGQKKSWKKLWKIFYIWAPKIRTPFILTKFFVLSKLQFLLRQLCI